MARRPGEIDGDLILADHGGCLDVEHGIEAERVGKIHIAARERIRIAAKRHLAAEQMNVSEKRGTIPRAAQTNDCRPPRGARRPIRCALPEWSDLPCQM